jgi:hypothetical protein
VTSVVEATDPTMQIAMEHRGAWVLVELGAWRRRAGDDPGGTPAETAGPHALELAGEVRAAAAASGKLGVRSGTEAAQAAAALGTELPS